MKIRALLNQHSDGLTAPELGKLMDKRPTLVRTSLQTMPDAYIDRWQAGRTKWIAVWCLHSPPPNAQKPEVSVCTVHHAR